MSGNLIGLLVVAAGFGAFEHGDAFDYADGSEGAPAWFAESVAWEMRDGAFECAGGNRSFAILEAAPYSGRLSVEATVTVRERQGPDWAVAGIGFRWDGGNYWHLALIEAPESGEHRHRTELTEMLDNVWLAQGNEGTRLTCRVHEGALFNWKYGHPYRLRMVLTPEQVEGFVTELDGTVRAHMAFALDNRAVAKGRPMLTSGRFHTVFDDVAAVVDDAIEGPEAVAEFPPYAVAGYGDVTGEATGFFYPKEAGGRWWLIDPNGKAFYMVGTDHVSYRVHWCEKLGYAPYARNVAAKYGSEEKWADATMARLTDWGFNTLSVNHSRLLRHRRFAHIEFLTMGSSFADVDDICPKTTWTGFPNVFNPKWPRHCDKIARRSCAPNKGDPWLIGYFLDNELEWFGKQWKSGGLFDEAWKKPAQHSAKRAWVAFLEDRLDGVDEFARHWGVEVADFEALLAHVEPRMALTDRGRAIMRDWARVLAEQYFAACREAILRHDPNHLILGCRFAGDAPDVWDVAGEYCDIVSFNIYPRIDVATGVPHSVVQQIAEWQRLAGRPMMVTEWSFPALDSGLPCKHGAGMRVDTQAQRTRCFTHFQTLMFALPFMVGTDFFMWADEPELGISSTFPEDSNYGLVNVEDVPYAELTDAARALNARVYELHAAGQLPVWPAPARLDSRLLELPEGEGAAPEGALELAAGGLELEGPVEGDAWRLSCGGTALGAFHVLIHQETPLPLWVASDTARITAVRGNEHVLVVDMELARSTHTDQAMCFKSGWRFRIPRKGAEWLASECLWVENTDAVPWTLAEVFHYLRPESGSEPLLNDIPNYYRQGAAWVDAEAGVGVACWYADGDAFQCDYWKDPNGGFHSDLREKLDVVLEPGQRHAMDRGNAFFFPLRKISIAAFGEAVEGLEAVVLGD